MGSACVPGKRKLTEVGSIAVKERADLVLFKGMTVPSRCEECKERMKEKGL